MPAVAALGAGPGAGLGTIGAAAAEAGLVRRGDVRRAARSASLATWQADLVSESLKTPRKCGRLKLAGTWTCSQRLGFLPNPNPTWGPMLLSWGWVVQKMSHPSPPHLLRQLLLLLLLLRFPVHHTSRLTARGPQKRAGSLAPNRRVIKQTSLSVPGGSMLVGGRLIIYGKRILGRCATHRATLPVGQTADMFRCSGSSSSASPASLFPFLPFACIPPPPASLLLTNHQPKHRKKQPSQHPYILANFPASYCDQEQPGFSSMPSPTFDRFFVGLWGGSNNGTRSSSRQGGNKAWAPDAALPRHAPSAQPAQLVVANLGEKMVRGGFSSARWHLHEPTCMSHWHGRKHQCSSATQSSALT